MLPGSCAIFIITEDVRPNRNQTFWQWEATAKVVLGQDTAHAKLPDSKDGKHVTVRGSLLEPAAHPKRFDTNPCVLGLEGYSSGIHRWLVELSYWGGCILGGGGASRVSE
ncbi:butyrophilin subfamily 2 member A2-like [Loxodonta africana]|uniref:butyrophilin subfamily 2 member A2-like n=1 Tax=Loxodonta africana TaxID=9785 RepID=UPI0030CD5D95